MIPTTQWLTLHKLCLDTIRGAIAGVTDGQMIAQPVTGDDSIGDQLSHLIGVEAYWLREVRINPTFDSFGREEWTETRFLEEFAKIENLYQEVLAERGSDNDVWWGLGRVCQHALYHYVKITATRGLLEPRWEPPGPYAVGSWERAVDFLSDLLIVGANAEPMND